MTTAIKSDENGSPWFTPEEHGHRLEHAAMVYLRRDSDNKSWLIDWPATQPERMDGVSGVVFDSECECDFDDEHTEAAEVARKSPLPTPLELLELLADALGYETRPKW